MTFSDLTICNVNSAKPKYLISDKKTQLPSADFLNLCNENEIRQRFGAVGKHGSIEITERAILTFKDGCVRRIFTPISKDEKVNETELFFDWYNEHHLRMQKVDVADKANTKIRLDFLEGQLHLPILPIEQI